MERRWNARAGKTGVPRKNPPASVIVQHDSHMKKSESEPPGDHGSLPCLCLMRIKLNIKLVCHDKISHYKIGQKLPRDLLPDLVCKQYPNEFRPRGFDSYISRKLFNVATHKEDTPQLVETLWCNGWTSRLTLGEPGLIPGGVTTTFWHVGLVPDDVTCRCVFSEVSRFFRPCIPVLFHTHLASPSSTLKISMLRAAQISSLTKIENLSIQKRDVKREPVMEKRKRCNAVAKKEGVSGESPRHRQLLTTLPTREGRRADASCKDAQLPKRMASSDMIPMCESLGVAQPGIEPGSPWWEMSRLAAQPPRPRQREEANKPLQIKVTMSVHRLVRKGDEALCACARVTLSTSFLCFSASDLHQAGE
ncbi:hypothetical protein PR048_006158 [Dryococelus australis]|uniref:Uncharacterized protein n=1 Tax=Dryococelus australis TaxID=614101 RepID=A0ABQ9IBA3_9NEOP|nr:hypothetical protein PR048_006158 [Dryococelus australis]